jgi:enolase
VFVYDGGVRYGGKGVQRAVSNVNNIIAPALKGMDAAEQREIDETIIKLDGTQNKSRLGGNATASVSAAVLKRELRASVYLCTSTSEGVNACVLPTPGVLCMVGSERLRRGREVGR